MVDIVSKLLDRFRRAGLTGLSVSIGNRSDKTTWRIDWPEQPNPEQEATASQIVEAFGPVQYLGVDCYDSVDVDRATNQAISDLLAPSTPPDLQHLRREKRLAETAALSGKVALGGVLTDQERAKLADNLQIYAGVMALSAAGDAFKLGQGWEDTDEEDK